MTEKQNEIINKIRKYNPGLEAYEIENAIDTLRGVMDIVLFEKGQSRLLEEDHMKDTPARVLKAWFEFAGGYEDDLEKQLGVLFDAPENAGVVTIKDIEFSSVCEHHLLPFMGKVNITYKPGSKIAGLSKFARLVDSVSRRYQTQENMGAMIADTIMKVLDCEYVEVEIEAEHTCMSSRGAKSRAAVTNTTTYRMKEDEKRVKVLSFGTEE